MTQYISLISSLLFFIFGAFSLVVNDGYTISPAIFLLIAICFFWLRGERQLDRYDGLFIFALLAYFAIGVFDTLFHGQDIANLDKFSRYLIAAFVLAFLGRFKLNADFLWLGFALGGFLVGGWAIYQKIYIGVTRVETNDLNAIHFGNLSMLVGVFCLAGIFWANDQKKRGWYISLLISSAFMAILASLFSGTRSGWIGFPFVLFALYLIFADHFPKKKVKIVFTTLVIVLTVVVAMPQTGVQSRIGAIYSDIENYINGYTSTSVGLRFEMWRSGIYAFVEKPILGWGEEAFYEEQRKLVDEHGLDARILTFNHLHNQYIEELAKRGLLGFAAFSLFLIIPFKLFYSRISSESDQVRALAAAGVVAVICLVDFCLTQAMLRINSGVMFYTFSIVFIWVCLRSAEHRVEKGFS